MQSNQKWTFVSNTLLRVRRARTPIAVCALVPPLMLPTLPFAPTAAFPGPTGSKGFYVVMSDADAPAHVYAHYATWSAAVHAVRTAYPFGQVLPAEWVAETMAA